MSKADTKVETLLRQIGLSGKQLEHALQVCDVEQPKQKSGVGHTYFAREIWMAVLLVSALIVIAGFLIHQQKVKKEFVHLLEFHGEMHDKHKAEKESLLKKHNKETGRMQAEHDASIDTHISHINVLNEKLGDDAPPMLVSHHHHHHITPSSKHGISTPTHAHLDTWDADAGC